MLLISELEKKKSENVWRKLLDGWVEAFVAQRVVPVYSKVADSGHLLTTKSGIYLTSHPKTPL